MVGLVGCENISADAASKAAVIQLPPVVAIEYAADRWW